MTASRLFILLCAYVVVFTIAADCNEKCPYGNNDCTSSDCTRCFPLYQNNWSKGLCTYGAKCYGRCDADTDCDQNNACKYCRDNLCTVAACENKLCVNDHDCHLAGNMCPYCSEQGCTKDFTCPTKAFVYTFNSTSSCQSVDEWHVFDACSSDCRYFLSSTGCKVTPNGLSISSSKCDDCICRGAQADNCYAKPANFHAMNIQTGHAHCTGSYIWSVHAAHDDNNKAVEHSQDIFTLDNTISCSDCKGSIQWILTPSPSNNEAFVGVIRIKDKAGNVCHFTNTTTTQNLANGVEDYDIILSPTSVSFSIDKKLVHQFTFTSQCPSPPMPLYASYWSAPDTYFDKPAYTSVLERFMYIPRVAHIDVKE